MQWMADQCTRFFQRQLLAMLARKRKPFGLWPLQNPLSAVGLMARKTSLTLWSCAAYAPCVWPGPCISIPSIFFSVKIWYIRGWFLVFGATSLVFPLNASNLKKVDFLLLGRCHFILTLELDSDLSTDLLIQNDILFCAAFDLTLMPRNLSFLPWFPS